MRKDLSVLVRFMRNDVARKTSKYSSSLERKNSIKARWINVAIEELQQKLMAKSAKIRRYEKNQYQLQNRMFHVEQKKAFK